MLLGLITMSHRSEAALVFILASFAVVGAVRADDPDADDAAATAALIAKANAAASHSQPQANKSPSLTTIVVNGGPSADILRSARYAGFTIKIANGKTHFCKTEATVGTRLAAEHCMNEQQLTLFLERAEDQREKLSHILGAPASAP
jgi:hypothetical protein